MEFSIARGYSWLKGAVRNRPCAGATVSHTFILQGFTPQNHIEAAAEIMRVEGIERTLISVAFVSSAGVELLADHIRPLAARTTAFVGVRNGITSAQAVEALLNLRVNLWAVDTGSAHVVFHPKLYYTRGRTTARLMVGSANMTTGGLNNNVEASVVIGLDLSSPEDSKLAHFIERRFDELPAMHPANISAFPEGVSLAALLADPRLVDERTAPARTVSRLAGGSGALNPVPLLKMLTRRIVSRLPKKRPAPGRAPIAPTPTSMARLSASYELLWTTTDLKERDLNVPKGKSTNATGSMYLDKGAMDAGFDYRNYFRNEVFHRLAWSAPDAKQIERAQAHFHLVIEGIDCGSFVLTVRHSKQLPAKSEAQHQPHTRISWGREAKPYVAKPELIGRTMRLSRAVDDPTRFLIEID